MRQNPQGSLARDAVGGFLAGFSGRVRLGPNLGHENGDEGQEENQQATGYGQHNGHERHNGFDNISGCLFFSRVSGHG
jgi:hypothetical protein